MGADTLFEAVGEGGPRGRALPNRSCPSRLRCSRRATRSRYRPVRPFAPPGRDECEYRPPERVDLIGQERVVVEIEDEGPGFDVEDVPDPTAEENLEKPSGRGIMLMRAFMDRVEYLDRGNRVVLEKSRGPDETH